MLERLRFESELELLISPSVAQAQRAVQRPTPFPVVSATNRTIFVPETEPFTRLPSQVRTAAIDELKRLYDFVGRTKSQKIRVSLLEPAKFPQAFAFSDAVVVLIASAAALQANVTDALRRQGQNASFALGQRNVTFANPFANPPKRPIKPETIGLGIGDKRIQGGRAFPFMAAYVALDEVMSELVAEADSRIHAAKVRKRRAGPEINAKYWGSHQALFDTAILSVLDNPRDPTKWLWGVRLFGQMIGRAMAHEVRHVYVGAGHAAQGLGADGPPLAISSSGSFSIADRRAIANAIAALERRQRRVPVVPTNPSGQAFPF
jgi:hypothetical protein